MDLRNFLATRLVRGFRQLQRLGIIPNPTSPGRNITFGQHGSGYEAKLIWLQRPDRGFAEFGLTAGDALSESYRQRIGQASSNADREWPVAVFHASDVKVWPKYGAHRIARGSFLDVYCCTDALSNPKYEIPRLLLRHIPTEAHDEPAVFLAPAWYHNHYHWMIDILPRLDSVRRELAQGFAVLVGAIRKSQSDSLRFMLDSMGFHDTPIVELPEKPAKFRRMALPTNPCVPLDSSTRQLEFLRSTFLSDRPRKKSEKRLYVSRNDAAIRRVRNEDELFAHLKRHGFEKVELANKSVAEQAAIFNDCEWVVGHHGAGLTNTVFCQPETKMIEIFQNGHFASPFVRIAQLRGLRYGYIVGERVDNDTFVDLADFEVLLETLEAAAIKRSAR